MTPERFRQVEEVFLEATAVPGEQRAQLLLDRCGNDLELRQEVEALLAYDTPQTATWAQEIIGGAAASALADPRGPAERIGPYRIIRTLGQGGVGIVYLAIRDDAEFRKEVAIKVLHGAGAHSEAAARFRHERQILAGLEHPYIARLLDGGSTEKGSPYLVMEYVSGEPITTWIAERNLRIRERLDIFIKVCEAVHYAHQKLIVHRDLKPGNILVATDGTPKLLDFGIAKLLDADGTQDEALKTRTGMRLMTPDYASPEQVRGEPVSTATDVYSLGAVLFELLTGSRPHRLRNYDAVEFAREICERPVRPPSEVGGSALRGDLDTIVLKAMHKDPERRYRSPDQLADDLRRYLNGFPVMARPDTLRYRAEKYARRHWGAVAIGVGVTLALAGAAAFSIHEARIAQARFAQVRHLANRFLFDFEAKVRPLPGSTEVRQMVVSTALEYLDSLSKEAKGDASLEWELAKAYERVGRVQGSPTEASLGRTKEGLATLERSIRMQEDLLRRGKLTETQRQLLVEETYRQAALFANHIADRDRILAFTARSEELAASMPGGARGLSAATRALALQLAGQPQLAIERADTAIRLLDTGDLKVSTPAHSILGLTYHTRGRALASLGRLDDSLASFERGLALRQQQHATDPHNILIRRGLAVAYEAIGDVLGQPERPNLGRPAEAAASYRKALEVVDGMMRDDPKAKSFQFLRALFWGKLGTVLAAQHRPAEAIVYYKKAYESGETLMADESGRRQIRAAYYGSLGPALSELGRNSEARAASLKAIELVEEMIRESPHNHARIRECSEAYRDLAQIELAQKDRAAAVKAYRRAVELAEAAVKEAPKDKRCLDHRARLLKQAVLQ